MTYDIVEDTTASGKKVLGATSTEGGITFQSIVDGRVVRTHDSHGLSLSEGNRAERRASIKNRGTGGKPKQYHKLGSK